MGKQLFSKINNFEMFEFFDGTSWPHMRKCGLVPFISFPDGKPCNLANLFILECIRRNLKSGTLLQYSGHVSHIIRFCYGRNIDFLLMDDSKFTEFIHELRYEANPRNSNSRKRESSILNGIGRTNLAFLNFVGEFHGQSNFVFDVIKAKRVETKQPAQYSQTGYKNVSSWHHHSFDTPSSKKSRSPISKVAIDELYAAISLKSDSTFLYRRRTAMLRLLEMTGARIGEIALLRVADLHEALRMKEPMLRMITLKRGKPERFVPVLKQDLNELKIYERMYRSSLVKKCIGKDGDHGFLFVSETTGQPLSARSLSNEVGDLRRAAGIAAAACAQMFRHRFITKLLVRLIKEFDFKNPDEFRKAMLDINFLKQQVQQYTGHKSVKSLDHYIDFAFHEITDTGNVMNSVAFKMAYESYDDNLHLLCERLERGMKIPEFLEELETLRVLRDEDLARYGKNKQA